MKKLILTLLAAALCTLPATAALAYQDITPGTAYAMATSDANVYILDVRTLAEWEYVGHPGKNKLDEGIELDGKVVNISYKIVQGGSKVINPSFLSDVKELFEGNPEVVLITMCRSGSRSAAAAALLEEEGYSVLNMLTGFEGGKDAAGYRTKSSWKNDGLPYTYSGSGYSD